MSERSCANCIQQFLDGCPAGKYSLCERYIPREGNEHLFAPGEYLDPNHLEQKKRIVQVPISFFGSDKDE